MKGIFKLRSAEDLMAKLKYEHEKLSEEPGNSFHAFNFFVTAWHMREWYSDDPAVREQLRKETILRICEHLATGAKHFEPESDRHTSVIEAKSSSFWADGFWAEDFWAEGFWAETLVVKLDGGARELYGPSIRADHLADHVVEFWRNQLDAIDT